MVRTSHNPLDGPCFTTEAACRTMQACLGVNELTTVVVVSVPDAESRMLGPSKSRQLDEPIQVSSDEFVPASHVSRHPERTRVLAFVRPLVLDTYAERGRPSLDPVVSFNLHLILFGERVSSDRQLMRVVADRLSLRWYLGYRLAEVLPGHSSLTGMRERYGVAVVRRCFEAIVERCLAANLVWGKKIFIDSIDVEANASLDSLKPRLAVEAHLARLFPQDDPGDNEGGADDGRGDYDQRGDLDEPQPLPVTLTEEAHCTC